MKLHANVHLLAVRRSRTGCVLDDLESTRFKIGLMVLGGALGIGSSVMFEGAWYLWTIAAAITCLGWLAWAIACWGARRPSCTIGLMVLGGALGIGSSVMFEGAWYFWTIAVAVTCLSWLAWAFACWGKTPDLNRRIAE